jgi:predicted GIY-YIG superfamily endonuclease
MRVPTKRQVLQRMFLSKASYLPLNSPNIPDLSAVYAICPLSLRTVSKPLYIGKTVELGTRIYHHKSSKYNPELADWLTRFPDSSILFFLELKDEQEMLSLEGILIGLLEPRFNKNKATPIRDDAILPYKEALLRYMLKNDSYNMAEASKELMRDVEMYLDRGEKDAEEKTQQIDSYWRDIDWRMSTRQLEFNIVDDDYGDFV